MLRFFSQVKDWFVEGNKGLHFSLAYIYTDIMFYLVGFLPSFISAIFFILLVEIVDKYRLKTEFSVIDLISGLLGLIICLIKIYIFY